MFPVRRRESIRIAIIAILVIKGSAVKVSLLGSSETDVRKRGRGGEAMVWVEND